MKDLLTRQNQQLNDNDVATLAAWAATSKNLTKDPSLRRAYALIREGSDLLLRQRAIAHKGE